MRVCTSTRARKQAEVSSPSKWKRPAHDEGELRAISSADIEAAIDACSQVWDTTSGHHAQSPKRAEDELDPAVAVLARTPRFVASEVLCELRGMRSGTPTTSAMRTDERAPTTPLFSATRPSRASPAVARVDASDDADLEPFCGRQIVAPVHVASRSLRDASSSVSSLKMTSKLQRRRRKATSPSATLSSTVSHPSSNNAASPSIGVAIARSVGRMSSPTTDDAVRLPRDDDNEDKENRQQQGTTCMEHTTGKEEELERDAMRERLPAMASPASDSTATETSDFYHRNVLWKRDVDAAARRKHEQREAAEVRAEKQACTFQPKVSQPPDALRTYADVHVDDRLYRDSLARTYRLERRRQEERADEEAARAMVLPTRKSPVMMNAKPRYLEPPPSSSSSSAVPIVESVATSSPAEIRRRVRDYVMSDVDTHMDRAPAREDHGHMNTLLPIERVAAEPVDGNDDTPQRAAAGGGGGGGENFLRRQQRMLAASAARRRRIEEEMYGGGSSSTISRQHRLRPASAGAGARNGDDGRGSSTRADKRRGVDVDGTSVIEAEHYRECTFSPQITAKGMRAEPKFADTKASPLPQKKSASVSAGVVGTDNRVDGGDDARESERCTFSPKINSDTRGEDKGLSGMLRQPMREYVARIRQMARQREEMANRMSSEKEAQEMHECTFRPRISPAPAHLGGRAPQFSRRRPASSSSRTEGWR